MINRQGPNSKGFQKFTQYVSVVYEDESGLGNSGQAALSPLPSLHNSQFEPRKMSSRSGKGSLPSPIIPKGKEIDQSLLQNSLLLGVFNVSKDARQDEDSIGLLRPYCSQQQPEAVKNAPRFARQQFGGRAAVMPNQIIETNSQPEPRRRKVRSRQQNKPNLRTQVQLIKKSIEEQAHGKSLNKGWQRVAVGRPLSQDSQSRYPKRTKLKPINFWCEKAIYRNNQLLGITTKQPERWKQFNLRNIYSILKNCESRLVSEDDQYLVVEVDIDEFAPVSCQTLQATCTVTNRLCGQKVVVTTSSGRVELSFGESEVAERGTGLKLDSRSACRVELRFSRGE